MSSSFLLSSSALSFRKQPVHLPTRVKRKPIKSSLFYSRGLIESARLLSLDLLCTYFLFISWRCSPTAHPSPFLLSSTPPLLQCRAEKIRFSPASNYCSSPSLSLCLVRDYILAPETLFRPFFLSLTPFSHYLSFSLLSSLLVFVFCTTPSLSLFTHLSPHLGPSLLLYSAYTSSLFPYAIPLSELIRLISGTLLPKLVPTGPVAQLR